MIGRALWLWALLLLCTPTAWSGAKAENKAEGRRLSTEMDKLAQRNAWSGVERAYLQLVTLEAKGVEVSHGTHRLGAQAAEQRGDMLGVWRRLRAAQDVAFDEETAQWLATVQVSFDRVVIELSPMYRGPTELEALDLGFDPTAQRTVATAREALAAARIYDGLLPLGRYRVGHHAFEVLGLGESQKIVVWPEPGRASARRVVSTGPAAGLDIHLEVTRGDLDPPAYDGATRAVRTALESLDAVRSVDVVPLPSPRVYVDFRTETLQMLGLTPEALRAALAVQLSDSDALVLRSSWLELPAGSSTDADTMGALEVELEGGLVNVAAFAQVRVGPDRGAPAPGLTVKLDEGADPVAVRAAIGQTLQTDPSAELLQLVVAAD